MHDGYTLTHAGIQHAADSDDAPAGSPSVSFATATSAAASSAGSDKAWSSGSNLAGGYKTAQSAAHSAAQINSNLPTDSKMQPAVKAADRHHGLVTDSKVQAESACASFDSLSGSGSNGVPAMFQTSAMVLALDAASVEPVAHQTAHARATAPDQEQHAVTVRAIAAAEAKAGAALQLLLNPGRLLPLLGLQSSHLPQQQQDPQLQQQRPDHDESTQRNNSLGMTDLCSIRHDENRDSQPNKAQQDMLAMLGLALPLKAAVQPQTKPSLKSNPQHTQQQAGFALELAEVLMDHALSQPEVCRSAP